MKRGFTKKPGTLNARIAQVRSWIRGKQEEGQDRVTASSRISGFRRCITTKGLNGIANFAYHDEHPGSHSSNLALAPPSSKKCLPFRLSRRVMCQLNL